MRSFAWFASTLILVACSSTPDTTNDAGDASVDTQGFDAPADASTDVANADGDSTIAKFPYCTLPGSIRFTSNGTVIVAGGTYPDMAYVHLPVGFCAHYFGNVPNVQRIRFAPGGELFAASPSTLSTYGGSNGMSAIVFLADDNQDGFAEPSVAFLSSIPSTQGLLFASGYFYYQNATKIMRRPYKVGDRTPTNPEEAVADITSYSSGLHWEKPLDIADDGTIYVGNGGDQGEACTLPHPMHGGIFQIDSAPGSNPGGIPIARGLREPTAVRCAPGHDMCFALEHAKDFTSQSGGRGKLVPIHLGDDWGFPCCASQNVPYAGVVPTPDCSTVTADSTSFVVDEHPSGLDFETGKWPAPYTSSAFVSIRGAAGSLTGARVVTVAQNANGTIGPASDTTGVDTGSMAEFATGWDDTSLKHGGPSDVAFSADGRLFVANEVTGDIFWIDTL